MNQSSESTQVDGEFESREIVASGVAEINKSEVEAQLDAAHRHPRSIKSFTKEYQRKTTRVIPVFELERKG